MRRKTQTYQRSLSEFARRFRHRPAECHCHIYRILQPLALEFPRLNLEKVYSWNLEKLPKIWKKIKNDQKVSDHRNHRVGSKLFQLIFWGFRSIPEPHCHTLPIFASQMLRRLWEPPPSHVSTLSAGSLSEKWVGPGVILMKAYESYYSVSLSYISYIHKYIYISMMPRETHNMPIFELMPVEIAANQTKWTWTVWTTAVILVYMNGFQSHLTSHLSLSIILDNSLGPSWPRFPHAKSLLCVPLETRTARKRST